MYTTSQSVRKRLTWCRSFFIIKMYYEKNSHKIIFFQPYYTPSYVLFIGHTTNIDKSNLFLFTIFYFYFHYVFIYFVKKSHIVVINYVANLLFFIIQDY